MKNGHRYLGGYIAEKAEEHAWVGDKVQEWYEAVDKIGEAGKLILQAAYAGMQRLLQQEWAFLLRVIPGIGHKFRALEERLRLGFFHPLLGGPITKTQRIWTTAPIKCSGFLIPDLSEMADMSYLTS